MTLLLVWLEAILTVMIIFYEQTLIQEMKPLLIKNCSLSTEESQKFSDILIEDGLIIDIKNKINYENAIVIDANHKLITVAGIDPHVHFHLETANGYSSDDFFSGSKAAIAGGTTMVIDFVTPHKNESLLSAFKKRLTETQNSLVDYSFHMSITSWKSEYKNEIKECIKLGMTTFKVYLAYKKNIGLSDSELIEVLETVGINGGMVVVHAENGDIIDKLVSNNVASGNTTPQYHALSRPPATEFEAVNRVLILAKIFSCPVYFVHLSTPESIELVINARKNGQLAYIESCPQYLLLDDSVYTQKWGKAAQHVISPPIRSEGSRKKMWEHLIDNNIDVVATDHCPFMLKTQKVLGKNDFSKIPNGAGGVEHRMQLLYSNNIDDRLIGIMQVIDLCAVRPSELFGLSDQKGKIKIGYEADLIIWNTDSSDIISVENHHQNCDFNIYEGFTTKISPEFVIKSGKVVFKNGQFIENNLTKGRFIKRKLPKF